MRVLEQAIADTVTALRQENTAAITFYKTVKMAATQNVPGTDAIIADLQPMLPGIKANRKIKTKQVEQGEE